MKSRKLILTKIKLISFIVFIGGVLLIGGCSKKEYPNPSKGFYVNDFANAFHPATKAMMISSNEKLYKDTRDIETIGGVQIVFATFLIDNIEDIAKYDKTEIFRQWKIGKNDMGVLVLMYFSEGAENGINYIYLEQIEFEVGYRMETYLPAGLQGRLLDETIFSNTYDDLDLKVANLFYEILNIVYEDVYKEYYDSYTFNMELFQYYKDNYVEKDNDIGLIEGIIFYLFGSTRIGWYIIIPTTLIIGGKTLFGRNRGGGGSSGGYGIFRRR